MKKYSLVFVSLLIMFSVAFVSCSKDDDKEEPKNSEFIYEGVTYDLSHGFLMYEGEIESGSHSLILGLLSSGILVDSVGEGSGAGDYIAFEMLSTSETELDEGVYNSAGTTTPGSFHYGAFVINANFSEISFDLIGRIDSGMVDVEKDGSTYKISFDCADKDDKVVEGYFEGPLEYYDLSEDGYKSGKRKALLYQ